MENAQQHCLTVADFGVSFGPRMVLADVDFSLAPGTITALLGPSGSGKSVLLRTLAGLHNDHPRFRCWGSVHYQNRLLLGQDAAGQGPHPRLVPQGVRDIGSTVFETLTGTARESLRRHSPSERIEWCANLAQRMGLPELAQSLDRQVLDLPPMQQRAIGILREAVSEPPLLMIDEPTANLLDYEAWVLLELIREVARTSTLLVVLHNQRHAARLADHMLLLAGGRIQEARRMENFLSDPHSDAGKQFVRSGSCSVPSLDAAPETLAKGVRPATLRSVPAQVLHEAVQGKNDPALKAPTAAPVAKTASPLSKDYSTNVLFASAPIANDMTPPSSQPGNAPTGFAWLEPGRIAGAPLPGVVNDIHIDLQALKRMGITMLITLTERDLPTDILHQHGLKNLHLPIYDHETPTLAQIQMLLRRMELLIENGEVLAVHCLAGKGRTGIVLACWWVREGLTAEEALRRVRLIDPRYVQNAEQEEFLQRYEDIILQKIL